MYEHLSILKRNNDACACAWMRKRRLYQLRAHLGTTVSIWYLSCFSLKGWAFFFFFSNCCCRVRPCNRNPVLRWERSWLTATGVRFAARAKRSHALAWPVEFNDLTKRSRWRKRNGYEIFNTTQTTNEIMPGIKSATSKKI